MKTVVCEVAEAPDDVFELIYEVLYREYDVDYDAIDWRSIQDGGRFLIKYDENGTPVGALRLMPRGESPKRRQFRQMVVLPHLRGNGVGKNLILEGERILRDEGAEEIWLEARCLAYGFYDRLGYIPFSEEFTGRYAKIPHRRVEKRLLPRA